MTINTIYAPSQQTISGVGPYNFTFDVIDENDIQVQVDGSIIPPAEYILNLTGAPPIYTGGSVTFLIAPRAGAPLIISRVTDSTQQTDYTPRGPFPAESHEFALDKLTMLVQEAKTLGGGASGTGFLPLAGGTMDQEAEVNWTTGTAEMATGFENVFGFPAWVMAPVTGSDDIGFVYSNDQDGTRSMVYEVDGTLSLNGRPALTLLKDTAVVIKSDLDGLGNGGGSGFLPLSGGDMLVNAEISFTTANAARGIFTANSAFGFNAWAWAPDNDSPDIGFVFTVDNAGTKSLVYEVDGTIQVNGRPDFAELPDNALATKADVQTGGGQFLPLAGGDMDANAQIAFTTLPGARGLFAANAAFGFNAWAWAPDTGSADIGFVFSVDNAGTKALVYEVDGSLNLTGRPDLADLPDNALVTKADLTVQGVPEAPNDGLLYARRNLDWEAISTGGVVSWGNIDGTLSNQDDLQLELDGKLNITAPVVESGGLTVDNSSALNGGQIYVDVGDDIGSASIGGISAISNETSLLLAARSAVGALIPFTINANGNVISTGGRLTNIAAPSVGTDATNKVYVDDKFTNTFVTGTLSVVGTNTVGGTTALVNFDDGAGTGNVFGIICPINTGVTLQARDDDNTARVITLSKTGDVFTSGITSFDYVDAKFIDPFFTGKLTISDTLPSSGVVGSELEHFETIGGAFIGLSGVSASTGVSLIAKGPGGEQIFFSIFPSGAIETTGVTSFDYVDDAIDGLLTDPTITGDLTMSGGLVKGMNTAPVDDGDATSKLYVDFLTDGAKQTAVWGSDNITGTLSDQTDLQFVLDGKLNSSDPSVRGTLTMTNAGIDMVGSRVENMGAPVNGQDATSKLYVDGALAAKMNVASPVGTGDLTMQNNGVNGGGAMLRSDDFGGATLVLLTGSTNNSIVGLTALDDVGTTTTFSVNANGTMSAGGARLTTLADPTNAQDAATKAWVEANFVAI